MFSYRGLLILLLAASLSGCGKRGAGADGVPGAAGRSCTVIQLDGAAKIICDDGSEALITDGSDGTAGTDGQDGTPGADGQDGAPGVDGQDGVDGEDGASCTVAPVKNGYLLKCPDGTSAFIPKKHGH